MTDIQWDSPASLMRVTRFDTADPQEELVGRGTLMELVGAVLEMPPAAQDGLLLRAAGPDWLQEYDRDAIHELATRPEFSGAANRWDTANLRDDQDVREEVETMVTGSGSTVGAASPQDADATGR
jgi:hypothetical protein